MSFFQPKRIPYRIILPFVLLLTVTTTFFWLFSAYFITRHLDRNLKQQMEQVVSIISRSSFVLNPGILHQLKQVINSEIVLCDQNGQVLSSTFSDHDIHDELAGILEGRSNLDKLFLGKDLKHGGVKYRTVIHPVVLPEHGQALLTLWVPTCDADRLKGRIILGMGGIALFGIFAMTVVGYLIARTITAPVEDLVKVTERVSKGDLNERVLVQSSDEIGILAESFNQMIEKLATYKEKLVESEKLATAGQMVAGLAHEVRNPLTSIKMLGQVLHGRLKEEPENQKMLRSMTKEIDRLDRIIQEMIDRTRPGELHVAWDDLNRQVEDVISVAEESLSAQHVHIERNLSPGIPKIHMDAARVKQVLWNLVLNAREAMPNGGRIIVSTRKAGDNLVEISIEDSGHGIASGDTDRIFQPFFTSKPEGVGLGLTMSRKIVEKHGGSLLLEHRPVGGALATVKLPINGACGRKTS